MERIRKAAEIALDLIDSITDIYNTSQYVEFTGTKDNKFAVCRVYDDGRAYTRWN